MKFLELVSKTRDELVAIYQERKREQFNLRFQKSLNTIGSTSRIRACRREIARIQTRLNQLKAQ